MSKVIFDGPNKLMVVASGIQELNAEVDIYSDWKEWFIQGDNSKYLEALRTVGGDPTVTGQYISPYYFLMNGWRIRPYEGTHHLVVDGNLYVEGGGNPFVPTLGNYNVLATQNVASISTATVQELEDIQYSSFQNGVWIDVINGETGTTYPLGNSEFPVNNFADAKTVAQERGFRKIHILGNYDFQATDNLDGFEIQGQNEQSTTVTTASGCSTLNTRFNDVYIIGVLDGSGCCFHGCEVGDLTGVQGTFRKCVLSGNITLVGNTDDLIMMIDCFLGTTAIGLIEIDMNGDGPALAMRAYTGGVRIKNKSGASKVAIDFISGRLEIESTVTSGTFFVRGVGEITKNLGTGLTMYDAPLTNPATVTNAVWDEAIADHQGIGSTAEALEQAATASGLPAEITEQDKLDIADRVWDEFTASHTTSGTFGKLISDMYIDIDAITIKLPAGDIAESGEYNTILTNIETYILRALGMVQENYYLDQMTYTTYQGIKLMTGGRMRIYSDASSVGTDNDVIATYQIVSTWSGDELTNYKVTKV